MLEGVIFLVLLLELQLSVLADIDVCCRYLLRVACSDFWRAEYCGYKILVLGCHPDLGPANLESSCPPPTIAMANFTVLSETTSRTDCHEGYVATGGDIYRSCTGTTNWSGSNLICQAIDCGAVPTATNMFVYNNSTTYNSQAVYLCQSGQTRHPYSNRAVYTCTSTGRWSSNEIGPLNCASPYSTYRGCFPSTKLLSIGTQSDWVFGCIELCKTHQKSFGGSKGLDCYCGDEALVSDKVDNSQCDVVCPGSNGNICGGIASDVISVYVTYEGCYAFPNPITLDFRVNGNVKLTCVESCRGLNKKFAMYTNGYCSCTDIVEQGTTGVSRLLCDDDPEESREVSEAYIVVVAKTDPFADNCDELYEAGVRRQGDYLMQNNSTRTCYFKDGTVCQESWIGNHGYCYYFDGATLSANKASTRCFEKNSLLVSITSSDEDSFIKDALTTFSDLDMSANWLIGLYSRGDRHLTLYDGNLPLYTKLETSLQSIDKRCGIYKKDRGSNFIWLLRSCSQDKGNSICKRHSTGQHCRSVNNSSLGGIPSTFEKNDMTVTWCIQACKGAGYILAGVYSTTCYCMSEQMGASVDWTNCNTSCPGNSRQLCGGSHDSSNFFMFVTTVTESMLAESCRELEYYGVTGGQFRLSEENTTWTEQCSGSACPPSWISIGQSCYKFIIQDDGSIDTCSSLGAYQVVIDNDEELESIRNTINSIRSLRNSQDTWLLGLFDYGKNGYFRWSNGRYVEDKWRNAGREHPGLCLGFDRRDGNGTIIPVSCKSAGLICERGPDYLGYYPKPSEMAVISNYTDMSVTLCVETCRSRNETKALLSTTHCWCSSSSVLPSKQVKSMYCYDSKGQQCGDTNATSVYSVEYFPTVASTCMDLFMQGILLSGTYVINGSISNCNFLDNTNTVVDNTLLHKDGLDYLPVYTKTKPANYKETCRKYGLIPASVKTLSQFNSLLDVIKVSKMSEYTKILIGASDEFERGQYSWTGGSLVRNMIWNNGESSFTTGKYAAIDTASGNLTNAVNGDTSYISFCMVDKDFLGCFEEDKELLSNYTVLTNFTSMTISQCKQLCPSSVGFDEGIILVGEMECYCIENATLSQMNVFNDSRCNLPCAGNKEQSCGGGGALRAYHSEVADHATYCGELNANGVMYSSDYVLYTSPNITKEECGYSDNSEFGAGWISSNGFGYWPEPWSDYSLASAALRCMSRNSYIWTPGSVELINDFNWKTNQTPPWTKLERWWGGVQDVMRNGKYLTASGHQFQVYPNESFEVNPSFLCTSFHTVSAEWSRQDCHSTLPFVCQQESFFRCKNVLAESIETFTVGQSLNIQQCVELCRVVNASEVGLHGTSCHCYGVETDVDSLNAVCDKPCIGFQTQSCGSSSSNLQALYQSAVYDNDTYISCPDLQAYGVTFPGKYILHPTPSEELIATCFDYGRHYQVLLGQDNGTISASSVYPGKSISNIRLYDFMRNNAWLPRTNDITPWIKVVLSDHYLVTAMAVRGYANYWCSNITVSYRDVIQGGHVSYGEVYGNIDSMTVVTTFFTNPFVTNELKVYVARNTGQSALRLEIYGNIYKTFNHTDDYIGCFGFFDDAEFNGTKSSNPESCKSECLSQDIPFYGIADVTDLQTVCYCSKNLGKYGILDDRDCPVCESCTSHRGQISNYTIALYRTYSKNCGSVPEIGNSTYTIIHGYDHVSINGFGTQLTFTCLEGYEFPDFQTTKIIHCTNKNTWNRQLDSCKLKECPVPISVPNHYIEGVLYQFNSTVKYFCSPGFEYSTGALFYTSVCQSNKEWTILPPTCERIACVAPPFVENTITPTTPPTGYRYNDTITYTCILNSDKPDNTTQSTIRCTENGTWSETPPQCELYACSTPPDVVGVAEIIMVAPDIAQYNCLESYQFSDNTTQKNASCGLDFHWIPVNDVCKIPDYLITTEGYFCQVRDGIRRTTNNMITYISRSRMDCALKCVSNVECLSYNFHSGYENNCELLMQPLADIQDTSEEHWYGYNVAYRLTCPANTN